MTFTPDEIAAAIVAADPLNRAIGDAMRIWGADIPLDELHRIREGLDNEPSLRTVRNRQSRIIAALTKAGQPPEPLFDAGEVVRLKSNRNVVGVVLSLTTRQVQIRLITQQSVFLSVPHDDVLSAEPAELRRPGAGLTHAQWAVQRVRHRRELIASITKTTPEITP